jgi:hypothetical protein
MQHISDCVKGGQTTENAVPRKSWKHLSHRRSFRTGFGSFGVVYGPSSYNVIEI